MDNHSKSCPCAQCSFEATRKAYEDWTVKTAAEIVKAAEAVRAEATPVVTPLPAPGKGDGFVKVSGVLNPATNVAAGLDYVAIGGDLTGQSVVSRDGVPLRGIEAWLPPRRPEPSRGPRMLLVDRLGFERIEGEWRGGYKHVVAAHGGLNGRHLEVTFDYYGETTRNGERLIEFREVSEYARPQWFVEPPFPTVTVLARAIFDTDPDVRSFISGIADNVVPLTETRWSTSLGRSETVAKPGADVAEIRKWDPKLLQRAWDRDEQGWRARATLRAKNVLRALRGEL